MLWGSGERAWSLLGFDLGGSGCAVGGLRCGVVLAGGRGLGLWWGFKMRLRRRVGNRRPFARAASPLARRRFPTQRLHAPVLSVLAARLARRGMLTRVRGHSACAAPQSAVKGPLWTVDGITRNDDADRTRVRIGLAVWTSTDQRSRRGSDRRPRCWTASTPSTPTSAGCKPTGCAPTPNSST